jgi:hypothetical protein
MTSTKPTSRSGNNHPFYRRGIHKLAALVIAFAISAHGLTPVSANSQSWTTIPPHPGLPRLAEFISSVRNERAGLLVGVYIPGILALPVVQQPAGNYAYVSNQAGTVTQFGLAKDYGSVGLVAHNTHSGADFVKLSAGQDVILIYGDGKTSSFRIRESVSFQALSPNSPYSSFIDLSSGSTLSVSDLFLKIYAQPGRLVFLTCIERNGISTWGRLFIIAEPFELQVKIPDFVFFPWAIPE